MMSDQSRRGVEVVEVDAESDGQRVDNYLFRKLKGVPRSRIYRFIRKGEVRVNGGRVKAHTKLSAGDSLRIPPVRTGTGEGPARPSDRLLKIIENSIIYEDNRILILNKPTGIAVHGGSGISNGVIECLRLVRPDEKLLELVHRLDRDTSGCLMVARRRSALRTLQAALREGSQIEKTYQAVVHGRWPKRKRQVALPLSKNVLASGERISRVDPTGKAALTTYEWLGGDDDYTVIHAIPVTGRTHQIRVHCAASGHPVVGDEKYGDRADAPRMMLHASRLVLPPLAEGEGRISVSAGPDGDFSQMVERLLSKKTI